MAVLLCYITVLTNDYLLNISRNCHILYHYFAPFQKSRRKNKLIRHIFTVKFMFSLCLLLQPANSLQPMFTVLVTRKDFVFMGWLSSFLWNWPILCLYFNVARNAIPCKDAENWKENLSKDIFLSVLFFKGLESKIDKWLFLWIFFFTEQIQFYEHIQQVSLTYSAK